ncbi:MAG: glycerophosphodiester phosphodiesterase [Acidimicrobiia bacterium]|nr:glycerophosphodiester phosphodiesterase [Acidimicrobiia bacterium]
MHTYLDAPAPVAIAHRGGAKEAPENTVVAFARAVRLGYRHLETDVHLSADGEVVVLHDADLRRVTGVRGRVHDLTWQRIGELRVGGEAIPRLVDLLESFPDSCFSIDAKDDAVVGPLVDVVARCAAFGRVCFGAFSDRRLARIRQLSGGAACTTVGPAAIGRLRLASYGLGGGAVDGEVLAVPPQIRGRALVDDRFVAAAHARGRRVDALAIDDPECMRRLLDLGVDGIFTDRPLVLRDVLGERGAWDR